MIRTSLTRTKGIDEYARHGGTRIGGIAVTATLVLIGLMMVLPFIHEIAKSFSFPVRVNAGEVAFLPVQPTLGNYELYFDPSFSFLWRSFFNTIFLASVGTVWSVFFTAIVAFPLSRPRREFVIGPHVLTLVVFSIIFFPPIIPYFLAVRSYGLMNSLWAIILTHTIMPFHLILVINYYRSLPEEIFESCRIDGANELHVAWHIAIPLAKPVIATIAVFAAVIIWNILFHALLFIRDRSLMPLQPMVRLIMQETMSVGDHQQITTRNPFFRTASSQSALVLMTTLPIVIVYPLLQKYFIKGALLGAVKA